ncbi:MAG TPA: VWA domain-containing protein, partial [Pyrinomonadaceae bacterium]|nr:VWA domain-containing protein [Pyrinomonadaceae bacterium]
MRYLLHYFQRILPLVVCALAVASAQAQTKPAPSPEQDDVIRVNTELVQTDVMVFDKKGQFVDGLKAEQFALKVDDKPQAISFFDRVTSGKAGAESKTAGGAFTNSGNTSNPGATKRGRIIIFFVDDLHLAIDSLVRTRQALAEFIDHGLGENDQVAITSSSGQIGFLQQFTDDRAALRSAVARLNYKANPKFDMDKPPMSEYIALKIREGDEAALAYYVTEMQKQQCYSAGGAVQCPTTPQAMRLLVRERAQEITTFTAPAVDNTLIMLEALMRTAGQLPGRKILFMVSDGFYLNDRKTGSIDRIRRITSAAGRAGVVINTLDARGIISESLSVDNPRPMDEGGWMAGTNIGEITRSQDGLNALAGDTGGRAFRNTNRPMAEFVEEILDKTANYYLLAWRPDAEEQKRGKFNHIEASIVGRPDLTVRLRGTYFKTTTLPILTLRKKSDKDSEHAREDDMRVVIDAPVSQYQIPTTLDLTLAQMPGVGTQVKATIQITREALTFDLSDGKQSAELDIGGIFYNDKGKPLNSFVGRLRVFPVPENASPDRRSQAVYAFHAWLPAGLYQVRVGVRDIKSGRIGSAMQWIEIP